MIGSKNKIVPFGTTLPAPLKHGIERTVEKPNDKVEIGGVDEELELLEEIPLIEIEIDRERSTQNSPAHVPKVLPPHEAHNMLHKAQETVFVSVSDEGALASAKTPVVETPSASEVTPKPDLKKYYHMLKCGLAIGAVHQRMKLDGVDCQLLQFDLTEELSTSSEPKTAGLIRNDLLSSSVEALLADASNKSEELEKYRKMQKCGLPLEVIEHKMRADNFDASKFSKVPQPQTSNPATVSFESGCVTSKASNSVMPSLNSAPPEPISVDESATSPDAITVTGSESEDNVPVLDHATNLSDDSSKVEQVNSQLFVQTSIGIEKSVGVGSQEPSLSPSKARAAQADLWIRSELQRLTKEIAVIGDAEEDGDVVIHFGKLFASYEKISDSLVGLLQRAKKKGLVEYSGEMLYQGRDNEVPIVLVHSNVEAFLRGETTGPRPIPSAKSAPPTRQHTAKRIPSPIKPVTFGGMGKKDQSIENLSMQPAASIKIQEDRSNEDKIETGIARDISMSIKAHSAAEPSETLLDVVPDKKPHLFEEGGNSTEKVKTSTESDANSSPVDVESVPSTSADDTQQSSPISTVDNSIATVLTSRDSPQVNRHNMLDITLPDVAVADVTAASEGDTTISDDDADVTGRGPPPVPPPSTVSPTQPRLSLSPARRRTMSIKASQASRSPSKVESMYDLHGRRRSSGTVYNIALGVLENKQVETVARDDITDALNWTSESSPVKTKDEVFCYENAQGVELAKQFESFKIRSASSKRRHSSMSPSKLNSKNHFQAATLIQRVMRGWMARLKFKSCRWVRDRLNSAVRSRLPEKVEEALAASRAISCKYVRPPEHDSAVAALDTIREERALRPKLIELSETKPSIRDGLKKYASVIDRVRKCRDSDLFAFRDEVAIKAELVYSAMQQRITMCERLRSAIDKSSPSDMMAALHECDSAFVKFSGLWDENFLDREKSELRARLVAIQHEEPAIIGLLKACTSDEIVFAHPEMLFVKANFEDLEIAIAKAVEDLGHAPATPGASLILSLGNAILVLKKSLAYQFAHKPHPSWNSCEKLLGDARLKLSAWTDSLATVARKESNETQWVSMIERELNLVSHELDKKAGVHDIIAALYDSVDRCDIDDIRNSLRKGERRGLYERLHDEPLQEKIKQAQEYLDKFSIIHARLSEVLGGVNRDPIELRRVADDARSTVLPNSTDARLVDECYRLCDLADIELKPLIANSLEAMPDRADLEALVDNIRNRHRMGGMDALKDIEDLLTMSESRLIQEQLRAATKRQDDKRKTALMIKLRTIHLESNPAMFRLENFSDLKDPQEWSSEANTSRFLPGAFTKREARAARMLYSSKTPIHAPLTKSASTDTKLARFAIKVNRTLLAYCGDYEIDDLTEFGGDVCQSLHEVLVYALGEPRVRDEVYCQALKHLTENKRPGSITRAWNFLALCFVTFPPSSSLDLFVEFFVMNNSPAADLNSLLEKLHVSVFAGDRPTAPTLNDIKIHQDDGGSIEGLMRRT